MRYCRADGFAQRPTKNMLKPSLVIPVLVVAASVTGAAPQSSRDGDWQSFAGDPGAQRFSH